MSPEEMQAKIKELEGRIERMDAGFRDLSEIDPQYFAAIKKIAMTMNLTDLNDVTITTPADSEVLTYDGLTDFRWENA